METELIFKLEVILNLAVVTGNLSAAEKIKIQNELICHHCQRVETCEVAHLFKEAAIGVSSDEEMEKKFKRLHAMLPLEETRSKFQGDDDSQKPHASGAKIIPITRFRELVDEGKED